MSHSMLHHLFIAWKIHESNAETLRITQHIDAARFTKCNTFRFPMAIGLREVAQQRHFERCQLHHQVGTWRECLDLSPAIRLNSQETLITQPIPSVGCGRCPSLPAINGHRRHAGQQDGAHLADNQLHAVPVQQLGNRSGEIAKQDGNQCENRHYEQQHQSCRYPKQEIDTRCRTKWYSRRRHHFCWTDWF